MIVREEVVREKILRGKDGCGVGLNRAASAMITVVRAWRGPQGRSYLSRRVGLSDDLAPVFCLCYRGGEGVELLRTGIGQVVGARGVFGRGYEQQAPCRAEVEVFSLRMQARRNAVLHYLDDRGPQIQALVQGLLFPGMDEWRDEHSAVFGAVHPLRVKPFHLRRGIAAAEAHRHALRVVQQMDIAYGVVGLALHQQLAARVEEFGMEAADHVAARVLSDIAALGQVLLIGEGYLVIETGGEADGRGVAREVAQASCAFPHKLGYASGKVNLHFVCDPEAYVHVVGHHHVLSELDAGIPGCPCFQGLGNDLAFGMETGVGREEGGVVALDCGRGGGAFAAGVAVDSGVRR